MNILTVTFAVCTEFVFWQLHEVSESACVAFCGGPVLSRHDDGEERVGGQSRELAYQAAATQAQTTRKI
jgi:hypothetical protein